MYQGTSRGPLENETQGYNLWLPFPSVCPSHCLQTKYFKFYLFILGDTLDLYLPKTLLAWNFPSCTWINGKCHPHSWRTLFPGSSRTSTHCNIDQVIYLLKIYLSIWICLHEHICTRVCEWMHVGNKSECCFPSISVHSFEAGSFLKLEFIYSAWLEAMKPQRSYVSTFLEEL